MKKVIAIVVIAMSLSACTSKTEYGECIGILKDKDPNLKYELSVWNTVVATIFFETVVVPGVVIANQHSCPVGKK